MWNHLAGQGKQGTIICRREAHRLLMAHGALVQDLLPVQTE